jgi:hypothetical protein
LFKTSIKSLGVAKTRQLRFSYSTGANLKGKHITAVIDSLDRIGETNEENNRVAVKIP